MRDDRSSPGIVLPQDEPTFSHPGEIDAVRALENRFDAHARDTSTTLALISAALVRIEKRLENNALGFEDANARIDRVEVNELELRRQLALLKPSKKAKRK
jgi:hypothetical protein